ncbi:N-lysine methyltransferase setd6 [Geodia barretti]|uniref:N-lysine methyltransferase setd6 n=1 Tax=Geodia barretti TaxID=519541 RepID=A0AA35TAG3_GEOBA|nr:N-lysine methyltransferase setd6 [Geodia barretti]
MRTGNSWIPLLLALLAETGKKSLSFWWPYLSLVPSETAVGPPHLWSPEERSQLLQGTGVGERVQRDLANMERDYHSIVLPFIQRHPLLYQGSEHSLQMYRDLVCLVMSYSFTDSAEDDDVSRQTMMVPFVDLLNHHSQHHAELRFHSSYLQLVAIRDIPQGSEVMNTYGPLSNASLLHAYGFTEEGNPHDVVSDIITIPECVFCQILPIQQNGYRLSAHLCRL